jgi:VIT1/CCC1 family predicted Fe2+/Mn2+ transporter
LAFAQVAPCDTDVERATDMHPFHQSGERHFVHRIGWLRAAVLGANDGIVSTASLVVGVAAASADRDTVLIAGVAGLVAGAMSMAAGEYVSVSTQSDTERADLDTERQALADAPEAELEELAQIYAGRGVELPLARQVAAQLMAHDDLAAHARDELGITETAASRPVQAALTSGVSFSAGAILPLATVALAPVAYSIPVVSAASLVCLALLGAASARAGGAGAIKAATRIAAWGALAMAATAAIGALFGTVV